MVEDAIKGLMDGVVIYGWRGDIWLESGYKVGEGIYVWLEKG